MTFLVPLALALAALGIVPILAHALWRGPARRLVFPAARFVPQLSATSKKQSRVEDRFLLSLRVLLLLALALLGASPFVSCSRLSLHRPGGGSLAIALVLDDSASMGVIDKAENSSRLERARTAALELVQGARAGDAFSIVLAGKPARLLSPATSDLELVRELLDGVTPSDRSTDLGVALELARSSLQELAQPSHQVLVLSDFATATPLVPSQWSHVSAPLPELARPFENCALSSGQVRGKSASVELACTTGSPPQGRTVSVHAVSREADGSRAPELGPALGEVRAVEGPLRVNLATPASELPAHLVARISPASDLDQLPSDDQTELLRDEDAPVIGVRADPESAGTETGGATVFELGLKALDATLDVQPLAVLPDNLAGLGRLSALVIDDPPGFTPEAQDALEKWIDDGGVALLLLGPRAPRAPLGAGFWPFAKRTPHVEATSSPGARPLAGASLGAAWDTWTELGSKQRATWDIEGGSRTLLPWTDGTPLLVEQVRGRGLFWVAGLPGSTEQSDLALRPAFLALLERLVNESSLRRGSRAGAVGQTWSLPPSTSVHGPNGALTVRAQPDGAVIAEPALEGRYVLGLPGSAGPRGETVRYATRDPAESLLQPTTPPPQASGSSSAAEAAPLSISREVALLALLLGLIELGFRAFRRTRPGAPTWGSPDRAPSSISAP